MIDRGVLERFEAAADRGCAFLEASLSEGGMYGLPVDDLAAYFKLPALFLSAGRLREAYRVLDHIKTRFMTDHGDFVTDPGKKSDNPAYQEYWAYPNAWILLAAHRMGRFDVADPSYRHIEGYFDPHMGAFATQKPGSGTITTDVLTIAHFGLTDLFLGHRARAMGAVELLAKCAALQPANGSPFYIRLGRDGALVTDFPEEAALFHAVRADEPQQAYFMIGYPVVFLVAAYRATGNRDTLSTAHRYLTVALACGEHLGSCHFSHKVGWGAAMFAAVTRDTEAARLALAIGEHLADTQAARGTWLEDEPDLVRFDQTAEIANWLRQISAELSAL